MTNLCVNPPFRITTVIIVVVVVVVAEGTYHWHTANTTGAIVKGGYGHTSVYDRDSGLIFVHAGYHSESSGAYILRETLYAYHPQNRHW